MPRIQEATVSSEKRHEVSPVRSHKEFALDTDSVVQRRHPRREVLQLIIHSCPGQDWKIDRFNLGSQANSENHLERL